MVACVHLNFDAVRNRNNILKTTRSRKTKVSVHKLRTFIIRLMHGQFISAKTAHHLAEKIKLILLQTNPGWQRYGPRSAAARHSACQPHRQPVENHPSPPHPPSANPHSPLQRRPARGARDQLAVRDVRIPDSARCAALSSRARSGIRCRPGYWAGSHTD